MVYDEKIEVVMMVGYRKGCDAGSPLSLENSNPGSEP
jgi:hypothetical protein